MSMGDDVDLEVPVLVLSTHNIWDGLLRLTLGDIGFLRINSYLFFIEIIGPVGFQDVEVSLDSFYFEIVEFELFLVFIIVNICRIQRKRELIVWTCCLSIWL